MPFLQLTSFYYKEKTLITKQKQALLPKNDPINYTKYKFKLRTHRTLFLYFSEKTWHSCVCIIFAAFTDSCHVLYSQRFWRKWHELRAHIHQQTERENKMEKRRDNWCLTTSTNEGAEHISAENKSHFAFQVSLKIIHSKCIWFPHQTLWHHMHEVIQSKHMFTHRRTEIFRWLFCLELQFLRLSLAVVAASMHHY